MKLSDLAISRPVAVLMLILAIIVLGAVSFTRLTIDLLPNIKIPVAIAFTSYSGSGPQEIESIITRPLEEAIATVSNIKNLSSVSSEGSSIVIAEFNWGTDMDFATLQMREKVDLIKRFLPDGAEAPQIIKIDPSMMPVLQLGVSAGEDQAALKQYAEKVIKPRLERIEGVASVSLYGGLEREIQVEVNPQELQSYGISMQQIAQSLAMENMNLPGGQVEQGQDNLLVRTVGEFRSVSELGNVLLALPRGGQVYLKDIAQISDSYKEVTNYNRINGRPSLALSIQKQSNANTVKVAEQVHKEVANLEKEAPFNLKFSVVMDQSKFIKMAIQSVTRNAYLGALLAMLVLFVFLRNLRSTMIVGIAIPISVVATFTMVYFAKLTLNMLTLGGLALGVGMLVDNSIVVLENIYRYRQDGYNRVDAAKEGTREVGLAIGASTLTTVAVFLPVVFVQGMAANIFKELALTVTFSLLASLLVALTIVPMLCSRMLKINGNNGEEKQRKSKKILDRFNRWFKLLNERYKSGLSWALDHRKKVVIWGLIALLISGGLAAFVGRDFFPETDESEFIINFELPQGRVLEETMALATQLEGIVNENVPELDSLMVMGGASIDTSLSGSNQSNKGSVAVRLVPKADRKRSTKDIIEALREKTKNVAGAKITFLSGNVMSAGMGGGTPVQIKIKGDDLEQLWQLAEEIEAKVAQIPGTREVTNSLGEGQPEFQLRVDREKAASYGLTTTMVASSLKNAVSGQVVTKYKEGGREINVRLQVNKEERKHLDNLLDLPISSPLGMQIPLRDLAEVIEGTGPVNIERESQTRVVTVTSQIQGRDLRGIVREIQSSIASLNIPSGYHVEFGGQNKEMVEAFADLGLALVLAIILVYMIMAAQFESLIYPLTIMFSLPLAFIGVVLSLLLTRTTLSIPAFIGVIMLAGIVVNNAIVLVDYINTLRSRGVERREAIMQAGPTRLRPILMTTLTTILGILPLTLVIGEGAELNAPFAVVVSGGLLFSTVLTLIVIPVVYTLVEDVFEWVKNKMKEKKQRVKEAVEG